LQICGM